VTAANPLHVDVHDEGGETAVTVKGEIDLATVGILRHCLAEVTSSSRQGVVVDLAGVTFMDSTGLGLLATTSGNLRRESRTLVLRNPTTGVRRVLKVTGLDWMLGVTQLASRQAPT
jgi:anti-anti-sigma factor